MLTYNRRELLGLIGSAALAQGRPQPNILYIMADDHAAHAISAYGSRINQTPNIDRIANGGVRLANCFCTNSICTPSRGGDSDRPVQPQQRRLDAGRPARPEAQARRQGTAKRRLSDRHDRQMAPGRPIPPASTTGTFCPARASITIPSLSNWAGRKQYHRVLHRPDRRFHARLAQAARPEEAVLPDVPSQGAAPPLGARPPNTRTCSTDATFPSRTISSTITKDARAACRRHHEGGRGHDQERPQARHPARPQGRRAAQVGLSVLHQGLSALHRSVDDNVGRVLDYLDGEGLARTRS